MSICRWLWIGGFLALSLFFLSKSEACPTGLVCPRGAVCNSASDCVTPGTPEALGTTRDQLGLTMDPEEPKLKKLFGPSEEMMATKLILRSYDLLEGSSSFQKLLHQMDIGHSPIPFPYWKSPIGRR